MSEEKREQQLVSAARQGDMAAFESLVHLYEKRVFALTLRMCGNREDAAEAAQEAVLAAGLFPGGFQLFHLAVPAGLQRLRGPAAAGEPPPHRRRPLPGR